MQNYTWKIESVDEVLGSMVVEFTFNDKTHALNLPLPEEDDDLHAHIDTFAPKNIWAREAKMKVKPGQTGTGDAVLQASEEPVMSGSWNEEYMRAMIYQVLEEIREEAV